MIHIILRTCLDSELEKNLNNEYTRICGSNRRDMITRCLLSLISSMKKCVVNTKLTILDDNSVEDFVEELHILTQDINCEIIRLETPDNIKRFNYSAYQQFKIASEVDSLVYVVEDDYLHDENALNEMHSAYNHMSQRFAGNKIKIYPFDCPFRYDPGKEEANFLLYSGIRYWRTVSNTTYTFFTSSNVIKSNFSMYEKLALLYPNENEGTTINTLYRSFGKLDGDVTVFSPIPSLAYHLSYQEPAVIMTDTLQWRDIWDRYQK